MIDAPAMADGADAAAARATVSVGMTVALAAIAMTFAALLLAYGIVRVQAPAWPPPGEAPLPALWALRLAATAAALFGSAAMGRAARVANAIARAPSTPGGPRANEPASDQAARRGLARALGAATAAGVGFLLLQIASLRVLDAVGVRPGSGLAASVVYALTSFHGLHALVAVLLSLGLLVGGRRSAPRPTRVQAIAAFWHLVTAVWLIVFGAVFVA